MSSDDPVSWQELIVEFLQKKIQAKEEAYLKDSIKGIDKTFKKYSYFNDSAIKDYFDPKKNKKTSEQSSLVFQREKFQGVARLPNKPEGFDWSLEQAKYNEKCLALNQEYSAADWIDNAASVAPKVSFATHVAKLTHSKIDSPSIIDEIEEIDPKYLTTSSLKHKVIDGVLDNKYAQVFQFLEIERNGEKLLTCFEDKNSSVLSCFSKNEDRLNRWNGSFRQSLYAKEKAAHGLLKQIYFPAPKSDGGSNDDYHLLCNMISSTLAQALHDRIRKKQDDVYKALEKNLYHAEPYQRFPNKLSLSVTASNHGNASQLNGKRGGRLNLLSCRPPVWSSQVKAPIYNNSWFERGVPIASVKENIDHISTFLSRFSRLELSTKDPKKRDWLVKWGKQILTKVMFFAAEIQNLTPGWSGQESVRLKLAQCYFLDPYREDENFQSLRQSGGWRDEVGADFARWLNKKLVKANASFAPQREHTRLWKSLMLDELLELDKVVAAVSTANAKNKEDV